jgi:phosphate transport system substrate-binding protein
MTTSRKLFLFGFLPLVLLQACKQKPKIKLPDDKWHSGKARFAADESFEPIVEQEAYIFKALNKQAKPTITYKDENDAVQLLLDDSVRMIMLSRDLDSNEKAAIKTKTNLAPVTTPFAIDAVTLIVNKTSNDTLITVGELKKILTGEAKTDKNIVFDNPGSSLVRYFKTLCGVSDFKPKNIFSLKSNKELIEYISKNPNAIGITSYTWLYDPDKDYADAVDNVKVMGIKDESNKKFGDQYFKPSQATLDLKQYPFARSLFIVNCSGRSDDLAKGLEMYMVSDKGQYIILESGILPETLPEREVVIKRKFN